MRHRSRVKTSDRDQGEFKRMEGAEPSWQGIYTSISKGECGS
jgi:hypothetical protein